MCSFAKVLCEYGDDLSGLPQLEHLCPQVLLDHLCIEGQFGNCRTEPTSRQLLSSDLTGIHLLPREGCLSASRPAVYCRCG